MRALPDEHQLLSWIEENIKENTGILAGGYQGNTLLYKNQSHCLAIKIPHGHGLTGFIHKLMLRHEYNVYKKLSDYKWSPLCYGMIDNTYLALEYINGKSIRDRRPDNEDEFINSLLQAIKELHQIGVAHFDLKRKDNLLVTNNNQPCLIDFGTAVIRKEGFHPVNRFLFNLGRRFDYNAWIKHKYHNNMDKISEHDARYYKRTFLEHISSRIKHIYTGIKKWSEK